MVDADANNQIDINAVTTTYSTSVNKSPFIVTKPETVGNPK